VPPPRPPERLHDASIRVDSKVIEETDQEGAKDDNRRWMRYTLDTVGKLDWLHDSQGRPQYPKGFVRQAARVSDAVADLVAP
jgi:type III restriction enzyme